jgi:hypothetical protein
MIRCAFTKEQEQAYLLQLRPRQLLMERIERGLFPSSRRADGQNRAAILPPWPRVGVKQK